MVNQKLPKTAIVLGEETYINAVYELVTYIYMRDHAVRESEISMQKYIKAHGEATKEMIQADLELKGQAIMQYLKQVKQESNIQ